MNWQDHITIDPTVMVGKSVIKGTRLSVDFVLNLLAQGWSESDILHNYPGITDADIRACLKYATESLRLEKSC